MMGEIFIGFAILTVGFLISAGIDKINENLEKLVHYSQEERSSNTNEQNDTE